VLVICDFAECMAVKLVTLIQSFAVDRCFFDEVLLDQKRGAFKSIAEFAFKLLTFKDVSDFIRDLFI